MTNSIALHFALALLGVSAVIDHDAVAESRIRELKAEAAREDIVTIRRAAVSDNPFLLLAAKLRGWLDGINLAFKLLRDKPEFSASDAKQITGGPGNQYLPGGQEESFQGSNRADILGEYGCR
jgi:hypothetical protein